MIELKIILSALTFLYIHERVFIGWIEHTKLNFEPINCAFCLSFWIGLILFICSFDLIYLSLPLFYRITQVKLLK